MVGHLTLKQRMQQTRRRKRKQFTVMGTLISPHYIKTSNNRYLRLSERRDDDLGVVMYWMVQLTSSGKYEVLKRLDPRYCESKEKR